MLAPGLFATEFEIPTAYGSYEELYADPDIDVIYIATPHPMHVDEVIRACEAGKHVLCAEKPLGVNKYEAQRMIDAARSRVMYSSWRHFSTDFIRRPTACKL